MLPTHTHTENERACATHTDAYTHTRGYCRYLKRLCIDDAKANYYYIWEWQWWMPPR